MGTCSWFHQFKDMLLEPFGLASFDCSVAKSEEDVERIKERRKGGTAAMQSQPCGASRSYESKIRSSHKRWFLWGSKSAALNWTVGMEKQSRIFKQQPACLFMDQMRGWWVLGCVLPSELLSSSWNVHFETFCCLKEENPQIKAQSGKVLGC